MREVNTPRSSMINKVSYDAGRMYVEFKSGGTYLYENVPESFFDEVYKGADKISVGRWYASKIKGKFLGKKVK